MRVMAIGGCSDLCDLPNLALIEDLCREAQMVEHHYRNVERDLEEKQRKDKKMSGLPIDEAELFLGASKSGFERAHRKALGA